MIIVYCAAIYYGALIIIYIYDAMHPRLPQLARTSRAHARVLERAPMPQPVPTGIELSWDLTHDEVLPFLSPSIRGDFQSPPTVKRGRKPRNDRYHPYSKDAGRRPSNSGASKGSGSSSSSSGDA